MEAVGRGLVLAVLLLTACGEVPSGATQAEPSDDAASVSAGATPAAPALVPDDYTGPFQVTTTVLESPDHGPRLCLSGVAESYPPQCGNLDVLGWDWADLDPGAYESAHGTTWGDFVVTGTYDGTSFTLTEPPRPRDPAEPPTDPRRVDADRLETPCPEPAGGWTPVDPARATDEALSAAVQRANATDGIGGVWVDQRLPRSELEEGRANDPTRLVLNVSTTGDVHALEASLREVWGGSLCVSVAPRSEAELLAVQERLVSRTEHLTSSVDTTAGQVELLVPVAWESLAQEIEAEYGPGVVRLGGALQPASDVAASE